MQDIEGMMIGNQNNKLNELLNSSKHAYYKA